MSETICWRCQNACGRCSWSKNFTPIEGWVAERKDVKIAIGEYAESYEVITCPLFKEDEVKDEID